ncbi:hypothetical protein UA08_03329 [Talaromyces atroroseus]|uniref:Phenylalanine ammonia-lyase n=1 Tax=Talaromyces atroroseus TaxID=1441469 RepID=A0A225B0K4_TALAT|nr:hypothetical protein UA08_03329 [Talaromyces atroroseus]OKL61499.1 hypothetical protein UA08_03329 [Talaromyces atroroseus]
MTMNKTILSHWDSFSTKAQSKNCREALNGSNLDVATVVAVAKHGALSEIEQNALEAVENSANVLESKLAAGEVIYGVNTGFGGSANTRTDAVEDLQQNLLRMLQYGVLHTPLVLERSNEPMKGEYQALPDNAFKPPEFPLSDAATSTCMPESWVRASMLIRLNSLLSGLSGVKQDTIMTLAKLVDKRITPRVPLRGSISASGDLSPLAYIGGVIQGSPTMTVMADDASGVRRLRRADQALLDQGVSPIKLRAKEGLAIVNGTAVSAAVGALALHEALGQAALAQVLTAMSVEAMSGTDESFKPLFGKARPHPGQIDVSNAIHYFLANSKLINREGGANTGELRQDRYSLRTAPQWIGPVLEDLSLAHEQVSIELKSVTDNPLVDWEAGGDILHGGNFQAKVVTSALEKTRQGLQTIGRILFSQCTEMINPATNHGLPPNLVAGDPSRSFIWKGTDIMIAALQAELGFLANPVGSHVQTAEMNNQAVNSLALISGRYTLQAVEVLTQLMAAHLLALCQALDLRVLRIKFLDAFSQDFLKMTQTAFDPYLKDHDTEFFESLWQGFCRNLEGLGGEDSATRFKSAVEALQSAILERIVFRETTLTALKSWISQCAEKGEDTYEIIRLEYGTSPQAAPYLGCASARLYKYVREELQIPFVYDDAVLDSARPDGTTIGNMITRICEALQSGALYSVVMECFRDALQGTERVGLNFPASMPVRSNFDGRRAANVEGFNIDMTLSVNSAKHVKTPVISGQLFLENLELFHHLGSAVNHVK